MLTLSVTVYQIFEIAMCTTLTWPLGWANINVPVAFQIRNLENIGQGHDVQHSQWRHSMENA